jgi:hypothetical protein
MEGAYESSTHLPLFKKKERLQKDREELDDNQTPSQ